MDFSNTVLSLRSRSARLSTKEPWHTLFRSCSRLPLWESLPLLSHHVSGALIRLGDGTQGFERIDVFAFFRTCVQWCYGSEIAIDHMAQALLLPVTGFAGAITWAGLGRCGGLSMGHGDVLRPRSFGLLWGARLFSPASFWAVVRIERQIIDPLDDILHGE